jgi:hypothetical protein
MHSRTFYLVSLTKRKKKTTMNTDGATKQLAKEINEEINADITLLCQAGGVGTITIEVKNGHVYGVDLHLTRRPRRKNN